MSVNCDANYIENDMKQCFEEELENLYAGRSHKPKWTKERVDNIIKLIKEYKDMSQIEQRNKNIYYYYVKHYDVLNISSDQNSILILKRTSVTDAIIKILPSEDYFDVLTNIHLKTNHGGRDKMVHAIKSEYYIPIPVIVIFVKSCKVCQKKKLVPTKRAALPSVVADGFNNYVQASMIDQQSSLDEKIKWNLHCQDQNTTFVDKSCKVINEESEFSIIQESVERDNQDVKIESNVRMLLTLWINNCKTSEL